MVACISAATCPIIFHVLCTTDAGRVVAIDLNDNSQTDIASSLSTPSGLCLSLDGETLYVAEASAGQISAIDIDKKTKTSAVGTGGTGTSFAYVRRDQIAT